MTERTNGPSRAPSDTGHEDDGREDDEASTMEDVDHTHPETEEAFADTGVYDRGQTHPDETDDE